MLCHHSILGPFYPQSSSVCNSTTNTSVCHASLQVLCDLVCVYAACVRSAAAPPGVPGPVRCAPADTPDAFATAVQVLRDTKHFVKDYGGGAAGAVWGLRLRVQFICILPAAGNFLCLHLAVVLLHLSAAEPRCF